jgi:hypothetical protein
MLEWLVSSMVPEFGAMPKTWNSAAFDPNMTFFDLRMITGGFFRNHGLGTSRHRRIFPAQDSAVLGRPSGKLPSVPNAPGRDRDREERWKRAYPVGARKPIVNQGSNRTQSIRPGCDKLAFTGFR